MIAPDVASRAQFQHLSEKDEHRDHRGRLEVDRNGPAVSAKRLREEVRRDGPDDAVEIGHARAHRDQGEHVEIARDQRLPAAHEERPACPKDDGRGEHKLDPVRQGLVDPAVAADQMAAHLQDDGRQRQREPHPEAARHVREFGIGWRIEGGQFGLQRHSADRAASGTDLADLRMHGTGVDRAGRDVGVLRPFRLVEVLLRCRLEFGAAAGRAEIVCFALEVRLVLAGLGSTVIPQTGSTTLPTTGAAG